ncbi:WD40/YVTN/BNR-like repeat-containing protein [Aromatoleum anaerobium]|uniref:Glycosyl hydrolase n=1 Tax=Aromatoleum anaerobium TaxID=182180 RepID=A0ABX1PIE1_9RHOO|nr:YCF48-related protein [Aromatoleum anaerobium]MCK0509048.1 YCF48-related protein [Aromatoleum anaerobium]
MDRLPDNIAGRAHAHAHAHALAATPPAPERPLRHRSLARAPVAVLPWAIIAGLLWAGLFVKPQPVGSTVQPPVLEQRDHFYGIALAAPGEVWVVGSNGKILTLGADGRAERFATPTERTLQDIALWDASHAVAVGNGGVILFTADAGRTWTAAADVPRSEVANKLNRVRVDEGGVAVATGEMGALLMSRDYGRTWTRLREEEDVAWNDVALLGGGRIRVVGEFGRILASDDDGASWQEAEPPVPSSLMAVAFRGTDVGVAVGLEGVVLVTRDGGREWRKVDISTHDHLFDIAWDATGGRWIGTGALGRWVRAEADATNWTTARLDDRDLSWHTRVVPAGEFAWFAGANVGRWDGTRWMPLGN